jgi:hypothetical protein
MNYTISDFYNTYKENLRLLCGKGGFSRRVSSVGILDYEFLPEVSGKYRHYNFDEGQLVVSTLMYARDNPNLVADAIKDLINAGTSGLIIKDIFRIHIPDTILRYAEAKNYPVFVLETDNIYVEDIIFDVKTAIIRQSSAGNVERLLDAITTSLTNEQEVFSHAKLINPSFETQHKVYYIFQGDRMSRDSFADRLRRYIGSPLDIPEATLAPLGRGILYITTWEHKAFLRDTAIVEAIKEELDLPDASVGVSSTHYYLGELGYSIREAMYVALISGEWGDNFVSFDDLGLLRMVFPLTGDKTMQDFSRGILSPIRDFDIENNGKLMETLAAWAGYGMSFPEAAKDLHQHENTLRYRMDKIAQITGLDFKKASDAQQLNMAYLIDYCKELKEKL